MLRLIRNLIGKSRKEGEYVGTHRTHDAAFTFRMPTGFPGDISRAVQSGIAEPCLVDLNAPPTAYGQAVVVDPTTQGVRPIVAGDAALTAIYGVTVRPFPIQQASATNYGAVGLGGVQAPPSSQPIDVLRFGYILVTLQNFAVNNSLKGGAVYIWYAASAGNHVQGGFEAAATGGSTLLLADANFNGPAGADGVVELAFNL
jgi:hypothetical protein